MKRMQILRTIAVAELLLLVPLLAMLFTDQVQWDAFDFIVACILLAGIGVAYRLIATGIKNNRRLAIIGILLAVVILLVWAELAVGIFGSPFAGS